MIKMEPSLVSLDLEVRTLLQESKMFILGMLDKLSK